MPSPYSNFSSCPNYVLFTYLLSKPRSNLESYIAFRCHVSFISFSLEWFFSLYFS